jgi:hypothetical protein
MFVLTPAEFAKWRSQFVTSKADRMGLLGSGWRSGGRRMGGPDPGVEFERPDPCPCLYRPNRDVGLRTTDRGLAAPFRRFR